MATTQTAAVMAAAFAALFVGHQLGDHVVQSNATAQAKATPADDRLAAGAHPWTGWNACAWHAATTTLTQTGALAVAWLAAPLTATGVGIALLASAVSHAVIDRRWMVQRIIRAKRCHDWVEAPYLIDQSLHHGAHLVAAVMAATVTTASGAVVVGLVLVAAIVAALGVEGRRARTAAGRIGDPYRF